MLIDFVICYWGLKFRYRSSLSFNIYLNQFKGNRSEEKTRKCLKIADKHKIHFFWRRYSIKNQQEFEFKLGLWQNWVNNKVFHHNHGQFPKNLICKFSTMALDNTFTDIWGGLKNIFQWQGLSFLFQFRILKSKKSRST